MSFLNFDVEGSRVGEFNLLGHQFEDVREVSSTEIERSGKFRSFFGLLGSI